MNPRNTDAYREYRRAYMQKWRQTNPESARKADKNNRLRHAKRVAKNKRDAYDRNQPSYVAKARAHQLKKFTPKWADLKKIESFYFLAAKMTKKTGVKHSVDHIVPLRGENVTGLHCEFNLQVLTLSENMKKRNHMPGQAP